MTNVFRRLALQNSLIRRGAVGAFVLATATAVPACDDGGLGTAAGVNGGTSTGASLSALSLSTGSLSPTFSSGSLNYVASEANSLTTVSVVATTGTSGATITVDGGVVASGTASGAIDLGVGANTVTIVVTAPDGVTSQTYTINVTRASP